MRLIDADRLYNTIIDEIDPISISMDGGEMRGMMRTIIASEPTIEAVSLDKLCELCEEIDATVPCVLCDKIMPEWCKQNNNPQPSWDEELKCPTWKQLLTKWMEELNATN